MLLAALFSLAVLQTPEDPEALYRQAFLAQLERKYDEAERIYHQLLKRTPGRLKKYIHYNLAAIHALRDEEKKALGELEQAFASGFKDFDQFSRDPDFKKVQAGEPFRALLEKYRRLDLEERKSRLKKQLRGYPGFPFDFDLVDLGGKPLRLRDLKGKVVLVDFWGTWCPPCRRAVPHLVDLDRRYRKQGLVIVGLNRERGRGGSSVDSQVRAFARRNKIEYRLALCPDGVFQQVPRFGGFPTVLFIDRRGKVRHRLTGYRPLEDLELPVLVLLDEKAEEQKKDRPARP